MSDIDKLVALEKKMNKLCKSSLSLQTATNKVCYQIHEVKQELVQLIKESKHNLVKGQWYQIKIVREFRTRFYDEPIDEHIYRVGDVIKGQYVDIHREQYCFWVEEFWVKEEKYRGKFCEYFGFNYVKILQ